MHRPESRRDAALPDLLLSGCACSRSTWLSGQYDQEAGSSGPHRSVRMASFSDQQEHPEGKRRSGRTSESGLQQHPRRSRMHHSEATRVLFFLIADFDPRLYDAASSWLWSIENGDGTRPSQEVGRYASSFFAAHLSQPWRLQSHTASFRRSDEKYHGTPGRSRFNLPLCRISCLQPGKAEW